MTIEKTRQEAEDAGIQIYQAGDGSNGDALAALFPKAWWAVVRGPAVSTEHGPFASEEDALHSALRSVGRTVGR